MIFVLWYTIQVQVVENSATFGLELFDQSKVWTSLGCNYLVCMLQRLMNFWRDNGMKGGMIATCIGVFSTNLMERAAGLIGMQSQSPLSTMTSSGVEWRHLNLKMESWACF